MSLVVALAALTLAAPPIATRVDAVTVVERTDGVDVRVRTDGAPRFRTYSRRDPAAVLLDVLDTKGEPVTLSPRGPVALGTGRAVEVQTGQSPDDLYRVVIELDAAVRYETFVDGHDIVLKIRTEAPDARGSTANARARAQLQSPKGKAPVRVALDAPRRNGPPVRTDVPMPWLAQGGSDDDGEGEAGLAVEGSGASAMRYIGFTNSAGESRVFARFNKLGKFTVKKEGPSLIVVEISDASIPLMNNRHHLDTRFFKSPIKMITPTLVDGRPTKIRLVIETREDVPYREEKDGETLNLVFKK